MMPNNYGTTMNPQTRMMKRVELKMHLKLMIFNILMGDKVGEKERIY